ncbi:MAG: hypothetical protein IT430_14175 [Phycisphaerales bacterium]|nr:hypothetical protein [Phycisphaerales bacterium]
MSDTVFRFSFRAGVDLTEVEATLHLSILAGEGLFGEARVRMEVAYHVDAPHRVILIDGRTAAGDAIVRVFTAFITREFGEDAFEVRRTSQPINSRVATTPTAGAAT